MAIRQRLSVRQLFDGYHPELNILVHAGAQIRVPQCERVYVVGNVKRPGAFPFQNLQDTTVLQLLALSGGLDSFSQRTAYIYREAQGSPQKTEIEIPLGRILDRKTQDVKLAANDILYVPTNGKLKASASVLNHVTGMGNTAVSAAIWSPLNPGCGRLQRLKSFLTRNRVTLRKESISWPGRSLSPNRTSA